MTDKNKALEALEAIHDDFWYGDRNLSAEKFDEYCNEIRQALNDGWRTIESFPKKGKHSVYYSNGKDGFILHDCYFHNKANRIQGGHMRPPFDANATHWLSLPSPPQIVGGGE